MGTGRPHVALIGPPYTRVRIGIDGGGEFVDATPAREHIDNLHAVHGMSWTGIARAAGVSRGTITRLHDSENKRCREAISRAVLAVDLLPDPNQTIVSAVGARRRIQALQVMGWAQRDIARKMGYGYTTTLRGIMRSDYIRWETHSLVRKVYDRDCMTWGGSKATATRARKDGYAHPMSWLNIDDPEEQPMRVSRKSGIKEQVNESVIDWIAVDLAVEGKLSSKKLTNAERTEAVHEMTRQGRSLESIATQLKTTARTIGRDRNRASRAHERYTL